MGRTRAAFRGHVPAGVFTLLLALLLAACGPEADRTRGGGSGADVGNRDAQVELHGDTPGTERMYHETPREDFPQSGEDED